MSITNLSLFKRSNGFWYILFRREGRQCWKSTGCTNKADALLMLTEFESLLAAKGKGASLVEFSELFLEYAKSVYAKRTVNIYSTALEGLLKASGNCLLTSLSPRDFDRYKIERLKDHAPVTVNMELRALKAAFNVAFKWAYVPANPFAKGQSMQVPEKPPVFLTKEDFRALFEAIKDEWLKEIFVFAVFTGMRLGEIVHLHWAQVDLENRLIHIQSNPTFKTKQGKRRTIPMNEVVFRLLQTKQNGIKGELVFSIEGQPISESWVTHRFKKYVTDAKLDESIHFHSLRHTFASWLVQAGSTLFEVQKLLGHSSSAVTEVYAHLQPTHMHETVNRICLQLDEHAD